MKRLLGLSCLSVLFLLYNSRGFAHFAYPRADGRRPRGVPHPDAKHAQDEPVDSVPPHRDPMADVVGAGVFYCE